MKKEIFGALEFPNENRKIFGNRMPIEGWAYSTSGEELAIDIFLDENLVDKGRWGLPRNDIYEKFSDEIAYQSGFMANLKINFSGKKNHSIKVIARSKEHEKLLGQVDITLTDQTKEEKSEPIFSQSILIGTGGRYKEAGERFLKSFIELAGLKPNHKILEIGSGMARIAMPLTKYLQNGGEYYGLDTTNEAINFCQKKHIHTLSKFSFYRS